MGHNPQKCEKSSAFLALSTREGHNLSQWVPVLSCCTLQECIRCQCTLCFCFLQRFLCNYECWLIWKFTWGLGHRLWNKMRMEREHFLSNGFVFSHNEKSVSCKMNLQRNSLELFPTLIRAKAQPGSRKGTRAAIWRAPPKTAFFSESYRVPQSNDMSCTKHADTSRVVIQTR